jgi:hypothetical protein
MHFTKMWAMFPAYISCDKVLDCNPNIDWLQLSLGFNFMLPLQIGVGKDADLLLLNAQTLELQAVFARGQLVKTPEWTRGGAFERGPNIRPHVLPTY